MGTSKHRFQSGKARPEARGAWYLNGIGFWRQCCYHIRSSRQKSYSKRNIVNFEVLPSESIAGYKTSYTITKPGSGESVASGSNVKVHATGVIQTTGKKFWSTKELDAGEAALSTAREKLRTLEEEIQRNEERDLAEAALKDAKEALTVLGEESKRQKAREEAAEALIVASAHYDMEKLREAIARAEDAGVCAETLETLRQSLHFGVETLEEEEMRKKEEEMQRRVAYDQALEALQIAMNQSDTAALKAAIVRAKGSGVDKQTLDDASQILQRLREEQAAATAQTEAAAACEHATAALRSALQVDDVAALRQAKEHAQSFALFGVDAALLEEAEAAIKSMEDSKERAKAATALAAASAGKDRDMLQQAIARAESVGMAGVDVETAKETLREFEAAAGKVAGDEIARLQAAMDARGAVALGAKITKAEKQKGKRDQAKKAKEAKEVEKALVSATASGDADDLRTVLARAESVGMAEDDMADARSKLAALEVAKKKELIQLALQNVEYAISQNDVEAATLALEEATAEGADPEDLALQDKSLADLRQRLDPEGEARRRRFELRKQKSQDKKLSFSGESNNPKFRADAEDEGEEGQEKEIRKQREERNKEEGYVPPPPRAVPKQGFSYLPPSKEELQVPRKLTLKAHIEMGAGIDLRACWWGMLVDGIDDEPGQPGLQLRDTIVDVNGTSLTELDDDDCEQRFAELFGDGAVVTVVPHVETVGILHTQTPVDRKSLESDLNRFAADWGVELRRCEEISSGGTILRIILEGPQAAVKAAKGELENLMKFYAGG